MRGWEHGKAVGHWLKERLRDLDQKIHRPQLDEERDERDEDGDKPSSAWQSAKRRGHVILIASALVLLLLVGVLGFILSQGQTKTDTRETVYVTIRQGMTTSEIGDTLQADGVVAGRLRFWLAAKLGGYGDKFKVGTYALHRGMAASEALQVLASGKTVTLRFTIPEGFTVKDIAARLGREGIANEAEILQRAKDFAPYAYMDGTKEQESEVLYRAEGFLFPDTYDVEPDTPPADILDMMVRDFNQRLTPAMREQAKEEGLSIYELVTLASLVEKEARYAEDRPIIAQVFLKRLAIGMPLQSDATLQYLMDAPKEDVSLKDTEMRSPYNSYQHRGLPPGPIANPGLASIQAVLNPSPTDYLYFVADREGHNHYSKTYQEHLARVEAVR